MRRGATGRPVSHRQLALDVFPGLPSSILRPNGVEMSKPHPPDLARLGDRFERVAGAEGKAATARILSDLAFMNSLRGFQLIRIDTLSGSALLSGMQTRTERQSLIARAAEPEWPSGEA